MKARNRLRSASSFSLTSPGLTATPRTRAGMVQVTYPFLVPQSFREEKSRTRDEYSNSPSHEFLIPDFSEEIRETSLPNAGT